jgi:hypothetical protein
VVRPGSDGICEFDSVSKDGTEVTISRQGAPQPNGLFGQAVCQFISVIQVEATQRELPDL